MMAFFWELLSADIFECELDYNLPKGALCGYIHNDPYFLYESAFTVKTELIYYHEDYLDYFFFILIVTLICFLMLFLCYVISSPNLYYEKLTGYECGFDPFSEARDPFEIKFYLVSILFILFDIELMYFFPWCFSYTLVGLSGYFFLLLFYESFLLIFFLNEKKKLYYLNNWFLFKCIKI